MGWRDIMMMLLLVAAAVAFGYWAAAFLAAH
jgi:hypothetical protein